MLKASLRILLLLALCVGPGWAHAVPVPGAAEAEAPAAEMTVLVDPQAPVPLEPVRLEPPERSLAGPVASFALDTALSGWSPLDEEARRGRRDTHPPLLHLRLCVFLC